MYDYATRSRTGSRESPTRSARWSSRTTGRSYDWCLEALELENRPRQIEFARLNLTYTILSKRKLLHLVTGGHVRGWTTRECRRSRAFAAAATRPRRSATSATDRPRQEGQRRRRRPARTLPARGPEPRAPRFMGVLDPLKVVLTNVPDGKVEELDAVNNPRTRPRGTRKGRFRGKILIERDDFREVPPPKYTDSRRRTGGPPPWVTSSGARRP